MVGDTFHAAGRLYYTAALQLLASESIGESMSLNLSKPRQIVVLAITMSFLALSYAYSHSGATGVVKQRMDMMDVVAKSMKSIGLMIKGETAFNPETVQSAASMIKQHAVDLPGLFPDGSMEKPSEALEVIWTDWDGFEMLFKEMEDEASKLSELASSVDDVNAIKPQFGLLAQTCKRCHEQFRLKK